MAKTSKIIIISTLLLFVIGLVGCGKVLLGDTNQSQNTNLNTNTATATGEIDTSDWQTYKNEEYGFEFRYPEDWILNESENGAIIKYSKTWEFGMKEGFTPFSVKIINESLKDFIKSYEDDFLDGVPLTRIISQKRYILDDKSSIKLIGNNAEGINSYYIFVVSNQRNYLISFNENEEVQRTILSTFHFLK